MNTWQMALLLAALLLAGVGVLAHERVNLRRAKVLLGRRPQLTSVEFGLVHFAGSARGAELAGHLRNVLAKHVPYDVAGLSPDDSFVSDLRMDQPDSLSTVEFLMEVEQEFGVRVPNEASERMTTFRDLLDFLDAHVPSSGTVPAGSAGERTHRITTRWT